MKPLDFLYNHRIISIIRGNYSLEELDDIADALYQGDIRLLEVTLNSKNAIRAIDRLSDRYGSKMLIGAGTVLTRDQAVECIQSGAQYILSPNTDQEVIEATRFHQTISIPGAFTATEVLLAHQYGAHIVKLFPARLGAQYLADLRGPCPDIPLLPTGGVDKTNIRDFLDVGAKGVGIGSGLVRGGIPITDTELRDISTRAKELIGLLPKLE